MAYSDRDYELFTDIGHRTASQDEMVTLDLCLTRCGVHKIAFDSDGKSVFVQIDPACRVPQVNLDSNTWKADSC